MKENNRKKIVFSEVVQALLDNKKPFPPVYLHSFSDLIPDDQKILRSVWKQIEPKRKQNLIEDLIQLAEVETEVMFDDTARIALEDENPMVRSAGIRLLWECNDIKLVPRYLQMLKKDPDVRVRTEAAKALGLFVYLGELEEINPNITTEIENALLEVLEGDAPTSIKLRALESLGYSSRQETVTQINRAFSSGEKEWISSALFAMGCSADADQWKNQVLSMLDHPILDIQYEAVQAAGMLELQEARQPLLEMLENYDETDENIRLAAITALSKIGGDDVQSTLESLLDQVEDEEEVEIIENALDYLDFSSGNLPLGMFNFGEPEDDDFYIESPDEENDDDSID